MADVQWILKEKPEWQDALVIVGFPTAGLASTIACTYLRRRLDLPLVGSLHLDDQSPVVAVQEGVSTSPLRVHGGQTECRLGDERCPWVYIISTDLGLQPDAIRRIGDAILQETQGARMVLCLDAVSREAGDSSPDVYCVSSQPGLRDVLATDQVTALAEGILVGMSGQILLDAEVRDLPAAALLVEAVEDIPDGRAAAALIHAVDRLLPTIQIDAEPLLQEAMELEKQLAAAQAQAERATKGTSSNTFI